MAFFRPVARDSRCMRLQTAYFVHGALRFLTEQLSLGSDRHKASDDLQSRPMQVDDAGIAFTLRLFSGNDDALVFELDMARFDVSSCPPAPATAG
jgi:hypothetical protein